MKLTAPQRACLAYYLWLETREGPKRSPARLVLLSRVRRAVSSWPRLRWLGTGRWFERNWFKR
jgi:hypothetical protein